MIHISKPAIFEAEKTAVMEVLESGFLAQGARTAQFEERFAEVCGVQHAIAVSSGTVALYLALLAHNVGPGDEVITTPFSFVATANAILFTGASPVLVDIEERTFNIDPRAIEAAVTARTRAIMPVHLYGHIAAMDTIQEIADKYGLAIIEDACQAVSASYKGKRAGSFGTGAFSFYATKNIMTGEGGMITTNYDQIAEKCRLLRNHGMKVRYYHDMLGFNFRLTDLQAAIGLAQLDRLEEVNRKRRENAEYFNAHIQSVGKPETLDHHCHAWHQYTVRIPDGRRDQARQQLQDAGIGTAIYYPVPIHQQRYIVEQFGESSFPVAERLSTEVLSLPVHPMLTSEERELIVEEVNKI